MNATSGEADHRFIPHHDLQLLRRHLREIPELAEDLAVTVMRQDRVDRGGRPGRRRRPSEQPLPFNVDAHDAAEHLHNVLGGWARIVCEHRAQPSPAVDTTPGLAWWLLRNLESLAMTPGSETALKEIAEAKKAAARIACPPPGIVHIDAARIDEARRTYMSALEIATLARDLGEEYRNLTKRRVHVLHEAGLIAPVPGPWHPRWPSQWLVGPVLDAHLALPIRRRHTRRERMGA